MAFSIQSICIYVCREKVAYIHLRHILHARINIKFDPQRSAQRLTFFFRFEQRVTHIKMSLRSSKFRHTAPHKRYF